MEKLKEIGSAFALDELIRPSLKKVKPYSTARDEFKGQANVYLDANENSLGSPLLKWQNRYPDPHQSVLKEKISAIKQIAPENIFLGNGSDECIDLLYRVFCVPGRDNVIICPPTYGMYGVSAAINDVEVREVPLLHHFQPDVAEILSQVDEHTKIIWLCSPNNPTGNAMDRIEIESLLNNFRGMVVVDEAYVNFSRQRSLIPELAEYPNLAIIQTFSKAWGLAALRVGMLFASAEIIEWFNAIKPPYNIGGHTQELMLEALNNTQAVNEMIVQLVDMREALREVLEQVPIVLKVYPSEANFILVKMIEARKVYHYLLEKGIIVRDRSRVVLCEDCLRITIGTEQENTALIDGIADYLEELSEKLK